MQLNFKQLASLPIFNGICEEDLPAMLKLFGKAFKKLFKKMKLSFWKVMRFEVLALYCLASSYG